MAEGRVLPYLDMPFQHASPRILKRMKRPAQAEKPRPHRCAGAPSARTSRCAARSSSGFPGETEADFEELLEFLEEARARPRRLLRVLAGRGCGRQCAARPRSRTVKEERRARFMAVQERVSAQRLARRVGRTLRVLVDAVEAERAIGRTAADAPEIDGVVRIANGGKLAVGAFARAQGDRRHRARPARARSIRRLRGARPGVSATTWAGTSARTRLAEGPGPQHSHSRLVAAAGCRPSGRADRER